jgi:dCTP deaminase
MIPSAQAIRHRCVDHDPPLIEPFVERGTSPGGRSFGLSCSSYDVRVDQTVVVRAHGFLLTSTVERFSLPRDLAGTVRDKSTWARVGLTVQNTHLDPGWRGWLTVELTNHSEVEIRIVRGEPIAQVVFELLDQPTESPYASRYQDQERGPQAARYEQLAEKAHAPCPSCGGTAQVVGGRLVSGMQGIDYIECACGYGGEQFEEDGILFDIVCNGNEDDYIAQYHKIKSAASTKSDR